MKVISFNTDPYGSEETVLFSFKNPDWLIHNLSNECQKEEPHHINECGIFIKKK